MEITFTEIRSIAELLFRSPDLFSDFEAEAIAKMVVLAGRDSTFHEFGPLSQTKHGAENVLGMEKCPDCGKYLRHTCGYGNLFPDPDEAPSKAMAEVSRYDSRPMRPSHITLIAMEGMQ